MCTFIFNMSLSLAESTSEMGQGNYMSTDRSDNRTDMFYAVFRTPSNSIQGSAVCAFKLADIEKTFMGKFKGQESTYHNWLPISHPNPDRNPHPSICVNDSYQISEPMLNFIKSHTLMDPAVPSAGGSPLIVLPTFKWVFKAHLSRHLSHIKDTYKAHLRNWLFFLQSCIQIQDKTWIHTIPWKRRLDQFKNLFLGKKKSSRKSAS